MTGLHTGDVSITIDVSDNSPQNDQDWEDIVEVPFVANTEKASLLDWNGVLVCDIPLPEKNYRVRYCARNIDYGQEVDCYVDGGPVDFYALYFWPAAPTPDAIIKQTSKAAAYWHNWVKNL